MSSRGAPHPSAAAMRRSLREYVAKLPVSRARGARGGSLDGRLALSRRRAADALSMRLTSFEQYVQPHVKLIRRGRMRLVPVAELERWIDENAESTLREG